MDLLDASPRQQQHSESEIQRHVRELLEDLQPVGANGGASKRRRELRIVRQPSTLIEATFRSLLIPRGFAPDQELDSPRNFTPARVRMAHALAVRDGYLNRWRQITEHMAEDPMAHSAFAELIFSMRFRDGLYRMWLTQVRQPGLEGNLVAGTTWDYDAVGGDEPDTPPHPTLGGFPQGQPLPQDWYRRFIDTLYVNDYMRWVTLTAYRLHDAIWKHQTPGQLSSEGRKAIESLDLTHGYPRGQTNIASMWSMQELQAAEEDANAKLAALRAAAFGKAEKRQWERLRIRQLWLLGMMGKLGPGDKGFVRDPRKISSAAKKYLVENGLSAPGVPFLLHKEWRIYLGQVTGGFDVDDWGEWRFPGGETLQANVTQRVYPQWYAANPDLDPLRDAVRHLEYVRVPTVEARPGWLERELGVLIMGRKSPRIVRGTLVVAFDPPVRLGFDRALGTHVPAITTFNAGLTYVDAKLSLDNARLAHPLNLRWVTGRMLQSAVRTRGDFELEVNRVQYGPRNVMPLTRNDLEPRTLQLDLQELGIRESNYDEITVKIEVLGWDREPRAYHLQRVEIVNWGMVSKGQPKILEGSKGTVLYIEDDPELARLLGKTPYDDDDDDDQGPSETEEERLARLQREERERYFAEDVLMLPGGQQLPLKPVGAHDTTTKEFRGPTVLAITWNTAGGATRKGPKRWNRSPEGQGWKRWIQGKVGSGVTPDLVVVALQEWNTGNRFTEALRGWLEGATGETYVAHSYTLKTLARFVGRDFSQNLTLLVRQGSHPFVHPTQAGQVCFGASKSCVKGSVAASIQVLGDPKPHQLVIVASHFPYRGDYKGVGLRDAAYRKTLEAIPALKDSRNLVLWLGDLNYRVTTPPGRDQLLDRMQRNLVFSGYTEGVRNGGPTFHATCKLRTLPKGADEERRQALIKERRRGGMFAYDGHREPSWCDRILVRGARSGASLDVRRYESVVDGTLESDHSAVSATLVYL